MEGIFYKNKNDYNEKLDPIRDYMTQLTNYVKVKKGYSDEQAIIVANKIFKDRFKDKTIRYFERQDNGDRTVEEAPLTKYIYDRLKDEDIIAPTFTSYINPVHKESLITGFVGENVRVRAQAKKESHTAKAEGNLLIAEAKDREQNNRKIYNNAVSGLFGQRASVLYNPTAHSTLTSTTRTVTSLGNTSNERIIGGNRYYPTPRDVLNAIVYESTYCDQSSIRETINAFNLHVPTTEETVEILKYSSDLYFYDHRYYEKHIIPYLDGINGYQRAAICYNMDLFHLKKLNDGFMRNLFKEMVIKYPKEKMDDPAKIWKEIPSGILNFIHIVYSDEIKGKGTNYVEMNEERLAYPIYRSALDLIQVLEKYKRFFHAFFMSDLVPTNSNKIGNMRRRVVVLSDTDSTCFALDKWVEWYYGEFVVNGDSIGLGGAIAFIVSESIVHQLAMLSSRMGVVKEKIGVLAMKSEFLWTVHVPAEISKHYFAYTVIQEGSVFGKPDIETKGVHLKNSAVPVDIIKLGDGMIESILSSVHGNEKISLREMVSEMIEVENMIESSVRRGESKFLKMSKTKDKTAYAKDEFNSPYQRHQFWIDVFEEKYGKIEEPPYSVSVFPTTIVNKTSMKEWIDGIEDKALANRLEDWLVRYKKNNLPTVYLNEDYLITNGVPDELFKVVDIKRIILNTTTQFRTILETMGIRMNPSLLIREQFTI